MSRSSNTRKANLSCRLKGTTNAFPYFDKHVTHIFGSKEVWGSPFVLKWECVRGGVWEWKSKWGQTDHWVNLGMGLLEGSSTIPVTLLYFWNDIKSKKLRKYRLIRNGGKFRKAHSSLSNLIFQKQPCWAICCFFPGSFLCLLQYPECTGQPFNLH